MAALLVLGRAHCARADAREVQQLCDFSAYSNAGYAGTATVQCRAELPVARQRCDALVELQDDLEADELSTLRRACYVRFQCQFLDPAQRPACRDSALVALAVPLTDKNAKDAPAWSHVQTIIDQTVTRVARRGGYAATLLVDALVELFPEATPDDSMSRLLREVARSLADPKAVRCKELRQSVRRYVEQSTLGELTPTTPLNRELLRKWLGPDGCLSLMAGTQAERARLLQGLESSEFVTVSAALSDRVTMVVGANAPGVRTVPLEHSIEIDHRRLFFAAVPRSAILTLRVVHEDAGAPPSLKVDVAAHAIEWWLPEPSCVKVVVAVSGQGAVTEPTPLLLVDGVAPHLSTGEKDTGGVQEWTAALRLVKARYRLTIVYAYQNETRVEHVQLDARALEPWDACSARRIDLSERRAVALVPVTVPPQCQDAGIDYSVIHNLARASLEPVVVKAGREWRDFDTWRRTLAWMGKLPNEFRTDAEDEARHDTSPTAKTFDRFQVYGKELLAQGIREAVDVELICDKRRLRHDVRFTVRATKINVDEANRRRVDLMSGRSIHGILEDEGDSTSSREDLDRVMLNVFKRLFKVPYVTPVPSSKIFNYGQRVGLRFEAFVPEAPKLWHVALRAAQLDAQSIEVCGDHDWNETWASIDSKSVVLDRAALDGTGLRHTARVGFLPAAPGTYLVKVSLEKSPEHSALPSVKKQQSQSIYTELQRILFQPIFDGKTDMEPSISDAQDQFYQCVRVKPTAASFWADLSVDFVNSGRATSSQTFDVGLRLALSDSTASGAAIGLRHRAYGYTSAVSWSDHLEGAQRAPPKYNSGGHLDFNWYRYSLPLSLFYEIAVFGTGPLFARIVPAVDLGLIDTRAVPRGLQHFVKGRAGQVLFDLDLDLRLELELRLPLVGLGLTLSGGLVGWDDALGGLLNVKDRSVITYDAAWFIGIGTRWTS
jgi:hypothetical protein